METDPDQRAVQARLKDKDVSHIFDDKPSEVKQTGSDEKKSDRRSKYICKFEGSSVLCMTLRLFSCVDASL